MTDKELLYLEDALAFEQHFLAVCDEVSSKIENADLLAFTKQIRKQHQEVYNYLKEIIC